MPYRVVPIEEVPFPHKMGERPEDPGCPFQLDVLRRRFGRDRHWTPDPQVYEALYRDPAVLERARACGVHRGDWRTVLPVVEAFIGALDSDTDPYEIEARARTACGIVGLGEDDRRLALSLFRPGHQIRIIVDPNGFRFTIGQHRVCAARTAGVDRLPVWEEAVGE